MGNEQGKLGAKRNNWRRSKKSRKEPDPKLVEEEQELKQEEEEQEEEKQEEEKQEQDEQEQEEQEEDCHQQQSEEKTEEPLQDRTKEEEGEGAAEAEEGEENEPLQDTAGQLVEPVPRAEEEFVGLNVGGMVYRTRRSTLVRYPNSLLGVLFTASIPTPRDDQGNYMIDGDGQMFRHVLNYLRRGALSLPKDFKEHQLLRHEAAFYQLPELQDLVTGTITDAILSSTWPSEVLSQTQSKVEPTKETSKYVIEVYVSEEDDKLQSWRLYGSLSFLEKIPTLTEYVHHYRKGSQCLEFTTQHPMFPTNTYRRFPKTTLFYHICNIGFKLHTSDCIEILDENHDRTPWLRYLFTSTT